MLLLENRPTLPCDPDSPGVLNPRVGDNPSKWTTSGWPTMRLGQVPAAQLPSFDVRSASRVVNWSQMLYHM